MVYEGKRGQISTEYMIVVGFIVLIVLLTLGAALLYSSQINDRIQEKQIEQFAAKIISSAESVKYAGEPSRSTISAYLPSNVRAVQIIGNEIVIDSMSSTGLNRVSFMSKVALEGEISPVFGVKKLRVAALQDSANITGLN
jgi:uncharacterized protein (UPF0333 family)